MLQIINGVIDAILGAIVGRKGSAVVSTVEASKRVLSLFVYKYSTTKKYLATLDDGTNNKIMWSSSNDFAGSWASVKNLTPGAEIFLENFIGKVFFFNGVDTPQSSSDIDGSPTWNNVTNAPTAGKFPFVLNQALHVLTESGFLWSSDVVDSTGLDFTSTEWTSRGINPNDGQKCTGAIRHRGRGVLFKTESIYNFDGSNEPEATINVGTHSHRSIGIGSNGNLYFHHPGSGINEIITGIPSVISRPVQKFLDNMDSANWDKVVFAKDDRHVYFHIGDVTINDPMYFDYKRTYTDVVLCFGVHTRRWVVFTDLNMRSSYFDELTGVTYFGRADGKIEKMNYNYAKVDGGTTTPISMEVIPNPEDFQYPERDSTFRNVYAVGRLQGELLAGPDYETLDSEKGSNATMKGGVATLNKPVTGKQLFLAYRESYTDTPPILTDIIMENTDVYDNKK